jgi:vancomycin resistance protein YoaR
MKTSKATYIVISVFILAIIFILPIVLGFGKSGKETFVLDKNYSTLGKNEIVNKLKSDFDFEKKLQITNNNRVFEISISSISANIDTEKMASNLLYRRLNQGITNYIVAFLKKKDFDLEITWDKNKLGEEINTITEQIVKPFIPTEIINDKGVLKIKKGELGVEVDKDKLASQIIVSLKNYRLENNEIPIIILGVLPSEEEETSAINLAKKLSTKKIIFNWENNKNEILKDTIISWVGFENKCNTNAIADYVVNFNKSIKQEPRDASFKFENNKVIEFEASRDGFVIDQEKMRLDICNNLIEWSNSSLEIKYQLPLIKTMAKVNTSEVNDLGIKELIGRGTSSFRHSSDIRNWNVQKGSEIINRILVAPGETFSFIKNLGDVSLDNGFKQAYVINKGKTVLDVGGGICQVSTTLFRAMLDAGLNITDRKGHAYRVSYYEEDSKPGFDATVFIPNPDLKFINDTGNYILIQSFYDGVKKTLAYEIYGTRDGRKVEISNYKQWDAAPAPPDVWNDDPTLPPGKIIKDESKVPGLKTSFDWKVIKNGEILHSKTYVTNYIPWAAVYRRGPQL